ncbi:MAG: serine hydrolase domain-containing protein [Candidatus Binataceae bacterium]
MRTTIVLALTLFAFLSSPASANAAAGDSKSEAFQVDSLFATWNVPDSPGCAVAVMKDGRIAYQHGYGMADLSHNIKITPDTVFYVGSMSKQFTATATYMLAQEGKISLDDPIRKYVPEVPDFGVPITLREMLAHTSGLRDYEQLLRFDGWRLDSPDLLTDGDVLYVISRQKELNFPPATDFAYSNTNYELLGQVVSRVSGQSLRQFTTTRIFEPLGMRHTHFRDNHGEVVKDLASPYEEGHDAFFLSIPNYDTVGATNVVTTLGDLALWDQNLYTGRTGGADLIRQLLEAGKLNDGTPLNYGNGWFINTVGGLKIEETGAAGDAGYIVDMTRFPDEHLSVATLCNLASIDPQGLGIQIGDIYLNGKVSAAIAAAKAAPSAQLTPEESSKYLGTYVAPGQNFVLQIAQRADGLWARWYWGPTWIDGRIEALGENRLRFPAVEEIDFQSDGNLTLKDRGSGMRLRTLRYTRVPEYKPTAADLSQFAGRYSSRELDAPYNVTLEGDSIVIHPPKMGPRPLAPLASDLFVGSGMRVHFTRDSAGAVSGFLMSGAWNRVQNLRFEREMQP